MLITNTIMVLVGIGLAFAGFPAGAPQGPPWPAPPPPEYPPPPPDPEHCTYGCHADRRHTEQSNWAVIYELADIQYDVIDIRQDGSCHCPDETCEVEQATCTSAFHLHIWSSQPGIGIEINGECGLSENWGYVSTGAPGCGTSADMHVRVTEGLCGGDELGSITWRVECYDCNGLDC